MKLAYVDSCIWIISLEGMQDHRASVRAELSTLARDGWEFCTSDAVRLEVLVRPTRLGDAALCNLYNALLDKNRQLPVPSTIFRDALAVAGKDGLKAMDALHCVIAAHSGCELFVTTDSRFSGLKTVPSMVIRL
ncbi:type II toxin-antitoxin system VapC family toxin [Thiocystis violacea]|uniref:type II toxin-antitoxin system VapC family toxin n=1 Tax=Thiocystis violacea TaxID=13725 RepID=UPI001903D022|nr:PIN domain-containing protein [Thiocystis violacea]MBK1724524.1 hypothetical protein [Thiocystis violacea]